LCVGADQCLAPAYTPLGEFPSFPLVRSFHVHREGSEQEPVASMLNSYESDTILCMFNLPGILQDVSVRHADGFSRVLGFNIDRVNLSSLFISNESDTPFYSCETYPSNDVPHSIVYVELI